MRIGELGTAADCDVETIRYYERIGLLAPPRRTPSGYRDYGAAHLARLQFIRHCRALQLSLAEIGTLLALQEDPAQDCVEVDGLLERHIGRVRRQRAALAALEAQLVELRCKCGQSTVIGSCAILQGLHGA